MIALGVATVAIPRRAKPSSARIATQRGHRFVRLVKWRTGSEARIACLKRDYLWRRTLFDGLAGAQNWCGWGVFAHNTTKATALAARADTDRDRRRTARTRPGSDPPTAAAPPAAA